MGIIWAPLWRLGGGFETVLAVNNSQTRPIEVEPLVYDASGRRLPAATFTLDPLASVDVRLDQILDVREGFGAIGLRFVGQPLDLAAQALVRERGGRLAYNAAFSPKGFYRSSRLAGVSPVGADSPRSHLAVSNIGDAPVRLKIALRAGDEESPAEWTLAPPETRLAPLFAAPAAGAPAKRGSSATAVSIKHDGAPGDVLAQGLLATGDGAAAALRVVDPERLVSNRLVSPALRTKPSQAPLLALSNLAAVDLEVAPKVRYSLGGEALEAPLPAIRLKPGGVVAADLSPHLAALPAGASDLGLELEYEAPAGRLLAELLLADPAARTLTQSSPKDPEGEGSVGWSFPFRLEAGGEAVVTLANPSPTEEVSYCVFLLYRGETYTYDEGKTLRPGEVKHVDLRRLRDEQIPGENDVTLPPDLTTGQVKAQIHNQAGENLKLLGQTVLTDAGGRAAAMSCPVCPPDPFLLTLSPSSFTGSIGTSQQIFPRIHWADGTSKINQNPNAIAWFPSNPSVAWVSEATANFRVQFGPQPGSTSIEAVMPHLCRYQFDHFTFSCVCSIPNPLSAFAAAQTNNPSVSCPAMVTRGQSATATLSNVGTMTVQWAFLEGGPGGPTTVTKSGGSTWSGIMVTSGTVKATLTPSGGGPPIMRECFINVQDRDWTTPTPVPQEVSNGQIVIEGVPVVLPVPPSPSGDDAGVGAHGWLIDPPDVFVSHPVSGPNQGYLYFADNFAFTPATLFSKYIINPDLKNPASVFSQMQWGACGFISHANLLAQTKRHEFDHFFQSHHARFALMLAQNNLGSFLENQTARPTASESQFAAATAAAINGKIESVEQGYDLFEPFPVNHDAANQPLGNINFIPYVGCP